MNAILNPGKLAYMIDTGPSGLASKPNWMGAYWFEFSGENIIDTYNFDRHTSRANVLRYGGDVTTWRFGNFLNPDVAVLSDQPGQPPFNDGVNIYHGQSLSYLGSGY